VALSGCWDELSHRSKISMIRHEFGIRALEILFLSDSTIGYKVAVSRTPFPSFPLDLSPSPFLRHRGSADSLAPRVNRDAARY